MDLDILFPECISFGAQGGPEFETDVVIYGSGEETRNQNWEVERLSWDVAHAARVQENWEPLRTFFRLAAGRANSFRYLDKTDYICVAGDGVFLDTDDTGSPPIGKQMYKTYTKDGHTYYRKIVKPITGTITVTGGGSLNYATGVVTGGTPTAWVGQFHVHCRFDTDAMRGRIIDKQGDGQFIMGWDSIPILEVKNGAGEA